MSLTLPLALDITGTLATNYNEEIHPITTATRYKAIVPEYGAFFTNTAVVLDKNGTPLVPFDPFTAQGDYAFMELNDAASELTGKEIAYVILILNQAVDTQVTVRLNYLGGQYATNSELAAKLYEQFTSQDYSIDFFSLTDRPAVYPPAPHEQPLFTIYGFESVTAVLERIAAAITARSNPLFDSFKRYIDSKFAIATSAIQTLTASLSTHAATNGVLAHNFTKADIGLGNVDNTADLDKPVSNPQRLYIAQNAMGAQGVLAVQSLNTVMTPGFYFQNDPANTFDTINGTTVAKYYPANKAGVLMVLRYIDPSTSAAVVVQVYYPRSSVSTSALDAPYQRSYTSASGWGNWCESVSATSRSNTGFYTRDYSLGVNTSADLNQALAQGIYYQNNQALATGANNYPIQSPGVLCTYSSSEVIASGIAQPAQSSQLVQVYYSSVTGESYRRARVQSVNGGVTSYSWSAWQRSVSVSDLTSYGFGTVDTGTVVNNVNDTTLASGMYYVPYTASGVPADSGAARAILVHRIATVTSGQTTFLAGMQLIVNNTGNSFSRAYTGSGWTDWVPASLTAGSLSALTDLIYTATGYGKASLPIVDLSLPSSYSKSIVARVVTPGGSPETTSFKGTVLNLRQLNASDSDNLQTQLVADATNNRLYLRSSYQGSSSSEFTFSSWSQLLASGDIFNGTSTYLGKDVNAFRAAAAGKTRTDTIVVGTGSSTNATTLTSSVIVGNGVAPAVSAASSVLIGSGIVGQYLTSYTLNFATGVGYCALSRNSGSHNTAYGAYALSSEGAGNNASGNYNVGIGFNAARYLTTGNYNTYVGGYDGSMNAMDSNQIVLSDGQGNIGLQINALTGQIVKFGGGSFYLEGQQVATVTYSDYAMGTNLLVKNDAKFNRFTENGITKYELEDAQLVISDANAPVSYYAHMGLDAKYCWTNFVAGYNSPNVRKAQLIMPDKEAVENTTSGPIGYLFCNQWNAPQSTTETAVYEITTNGNPVTVNGPLMNSQYVDDTSTNILNGMFGVGMSGNGWFYTASIGLNQYNNDPGATRTIVSRRYSDFVTYAAMTQSTEVTSIPDVDNVAPAPGSGYYPANGFYYINMPWQDPSTFANFGYSSGHGCRILPHKDGAIFVSYTGNIFRLDKEGHHDFGFGNMNLLKQPNQFYGIKSYYMHPLNIADFTSNNLGVSVVTDSRDRIILSLLHTASRDAVTRLTPYGKTDETFGNNGFVNTSGSYVDVDIYDRVYALSLTTKTISRFGVNGEPDAAFAMLDIPHPRTVVIAGVTTPVTSFTIAAVDGIYVRRDKVIFVIGRCHVNNQSATIGFIGAMYYSHNTHQLERYLTHGEDGFITHIPSGYGSVYFPSFDHITSDRTGRYFVAGSSFVDTNTLANYVLAQRFTDDTMAAGGGSHAYPIG